MASVEILECTLRDGSYVIDYQFTVEDTAIIAAGLEIAGFRMIEVGHGLGLNASNVGKGKAAATDEEYLEVVSKILKSAKFGMFFIPGIGRKSDLKRAAEYGMDFVRIGTNVTEAENAEEYIKYAKDLGFKVTSNLMKSYVLPLRKFIEKAKLVDRYGADIIYLVDSAGCMFPEDIHKYIDSLRKYTSAEIGFHGHDNLHMAISNTLESIKAGARYVDSTLQGIGRSAGNPQTEVLVAVLDKLGYKIDIDLYKTMELGEKLIRPLMRERHGLNPIEIISGYAGFHSSFLNNVYKVAKMYNLDPRDLIIEVSERDKVHVTEKLALDTAEELIREKRSRLRTREITLNDINFDFKRREYVKEPNIEKLAGKMASRILSISKKKGKESIFIIAVSSKPENKVILFPFIQENMLYVMGNAEIDQVSRIKEIIRGIDGKVSTIIVDAEQKGIKGNLIKEIKRITKNSRILTYKDHDVWVNATDTILSQLCEVYGSKITIVGANNLGYKLAIKLAERGGIVTLTTQQEKKDLKKIVSALNMIKLKNSPRITAVVDKIEATKGAKVLIGLTPQSVSITDEMVKVMDPKGLIMDAGLGTVGYDAIKYANEKGIKLLRLDMRAALSGEIVNLLSTNHLITKIMGKRKIHGIQIVAGGIVGMKGDVVVDSISDPSRVIGVADGKGNVIYDDLEYQNRIEKVRSILYKEKLQNILGTMR